MIPADTPGLDSAEQQDAAQPESAAGDAVLEPAPKVKPAAAEGASELKNVCRL